MVHDWEVFMFEQVIRGKVSDPKAIDGTFNRWSKELAPGAKGWLGTTGGATDDGELFIMVRFEEKRFVDLGPGYYDSRVNRNRSTRNHVRELQALGYKVTLEPAA
jgi:hypothetical protein